MSDDIVFGKNKLKNIVSIELNGDKCLIFREINGNIVQDVIPNYYWLLTPTKDYRNQEPLDGDQYYKFITKFDSMERLKSAKNKLGWNSDTYQIWNPKEAIMVAEGITYFKGMKKDDVSVMFFDFETTGIRHDKDSNILMISTIYRSQGQVEQRLFCYDEYDGQKGLLDTFCNYVRDKDPSIIGGHNVYGYDIPYAKYIAEREGFQLHLGRNGSALTLNERPSKFRKDGSQQLEYKKCSIYGREVIDTMFLAYKYDIGRNYESYGLKKIIEHEKLTSNHRTFYDASTINKNYKDLIEWEKIKAYCIDDAKDCLSLWDLMGSSLFYFTQSVSKPFQEMGVSASGAQINNMMVRSYLQLGHSIPKADETTEFQGALSLGVPGNWRNCVRWDVSSLYPSIMRQYEVHSKHKDPKGHFITLTKYFALERLTNKTLAKETGLQFYKDLEQMQKIGANSLYGFLSASGLNYNYPEGASFITGKGREFLGMAVKWASGESIEDLFKRVKGSGGKDES